MVRAGPAPNTTPPSLPSPITSGGLQSGKPRRSRTRRRMGERTSRAWKKPRTMPSDTLPPSQSPSQSWWRRVGLTGCTRL